MKRLLPILMGFVLLLLSSTEGWSLPPCEGSPTSKHYVYKNWTNCEGTLTYNDGSKYVGEFQDGKPHGQGTATSTTCNTSSNNDVFGGLSFATSHPINQTDYGCALVSKADGFPVFNGTQSAPFSAMLGRPNHQQAIYPQNLLFCVLTCMRYLSRGASRWHSKEEAGRGQGSRHSLGS